MGRGGWKEDLRVIGLCSFASSERVGYFWRIFKSEPVFVPFSMNVRISISQCVQVSLPLHIVGTDDGLSCWHHFQF